VGNFSVGVDFGYGEKKGTIWARCSLFGKRVDALAQYMTKGQLVGISGELSERQWTDKEGVAKTSQEVRVNEVTLLGSKPQQDAPKTASKASAKVSGDDFDSDIPF
jgi:single-strand DNA-binding protein